MKNRVVLLTYLAAVLLFSCVHDPIFLGAALLAVLWLAGKDRLRIAQRSALAVLAFSSAVTLSYCVVASLDDTFSLGYVVLINLRVMLLTSMTFLVMTRINLFQALGFSRTLQFLLVLAYSQALTLRRVLNDFRLALTSRTLKRLPTRELYRHGATMGVFLLQKSLHDTTEITQAMKSRGFFNDHG